MHAWCKQGLMHAHLHCVSIRVFPNLPWVKVHCSNNVLRHAEGVCKLVSMSCYVLQKLADVKTACQYMHLVIDGNGERSSLAAR